MVMGITWTHSESVWNPSGPLLLKPVTGQELFFAISYSKPALVLTSFHIAIELLHMAVVIPCVQSVYLVAKLVIRRLKM